MVDLMATYHNLIESQSLPPSSSAAAKRKVHTLYSLRGIINSHCALSLTANPFAGLHNPHLSLSSQSTSQPARRITVVALSMHCMQGDDHQLPSHQANLTPKCMSCAHQYVQFSNLFHLLRSKRLAESSASFIILLCIYFIDWMCGGRGCVVKCKRNETTNLQANPEISAHSLGFYIQQARRRSRRQS